MDNSPEDRDRYISEQLNELMRLVTWLNARVEKLETKLASKADPMPAPQAREKAAPPPPVTQAAFSKPEPVVPAAPPPPAPAPAPTITPPAPRLTPTNQSPPPPPLSASPKASINWEELIGGKWSLWVGSVLLFFTVAFILAATWSNFGSAGKLAIGTAAGAVLLVVGEASRGRSKSWFSAGLTGIGLAILYLNIWAGHELYGLIDFTTSFVLLFAVSAAGVGLSVRYNLISLCILSAIGGYLTPGILDGGGGGSRDLTNLWAYLLILNAALSVTAVAKNWRPVLWTAFTGTLIVVLAAGGQASLAKMGMLTLYAVVFALAITTIAQASQIKSEDRPFLHLTILLLTFLAAKMSPLPEWQYAAAIALILFGAFALSRTSVPQFGQVFLGYSLFWVGMIAFDLGREVYTAQWLTLIMACCGVAAFHYKTVLLKGATIVYWGISLLTVLIITVLSLEPGLSGDAVLALLAFTLGCAVVAAFNSEMRDLFGCSAILSGCGAVLFKTYEITQPTSLGESFVTQTLFLGLTATVYAYLVLLAIYRLKREPLRIACMYIAGSALAATLVGITNQTDVVRPLFMNAVFALTVGCAVGFGATGWLYASSRPEETRRASGDLVTAVASLAVLACLLLQTWSLYSSEFSDAYAGYALVVVLSIYGFVNWGVARISRLPYLEYMGTGLKVLSSITVIFAYLGTMDTEFTPFASIRTLAFGLSAASLLVAAYFYTSRGENESDQIGAGLLGFAAILTIVWSLTVETYGYVQTHQAAFGENWRLAAQMAVSIVWTISGLVLFLAGAAARQRMLRLLGLGLLGITSVKVFIFDVSQLDAIYRILSCGALGLSLIGISWLYSRFELTADRKPKPPEPDTTTVGETGV